jgi:hypothetical protein
MARNPVAPFAPGAGAPPRSWHFVFGGLAATLAALVLYGLSTLDAFAGLQNALMVRIPLAAAGLIAVGAGVARRLRTAPDEFEDRVESAGMVVVAAFAALAASFAVDPWDSIQMFLGVAAAVALVGAFLVLLPPVGRKVAVSLLVIGHFANTFVQTTTVPVGGNSPFLMNNAYAYVFRYYSSFMYLSNAFHFYSPDPGPPTLLWFHVRYTDGSTRWIKFPDRAADPVPLHYQRLLALTESTNQTVPQLPQDFEQIARRRNIAGNLYNPPIPVLPNQPALSQYQPPSDYAQMMVAAYARYIARTYAHPDGKDTDPAATVAGVKVYRVIHQIIQPPDLAAGKSPFAKDLDAPFFQGEFTADGVLKDASDPFLYWLVPVVPPGSPAGPNDRVPDLLEVHASHVPQGPLPENQP